MSFISKDEKSAYITVKIFLALVAGVSLTGWYIFATRDYAFRLAHFFLVLSLPASFLAVALASAYLPISARTKKIIQIVLISLMVGTAIIATSVWHLLATGPLFNP